MTGELVGRVPERALAVYAHPDDPDVACGGTLAHWVESGADVHVIICTTGDKGTTDPSVDPLALARLRRDELSRSASVLGAAEPHLLGYPDGEIVNDLGLRHELVGWIRRLRPSVVLCPDPTAVIFGEDYFNHRDHRVVGMAMLDAVSPAAGLPLYFPDAGPPHRVEVAYLSGTLEPTVWVDIGHCLDRKIEAVRCHGSQLAGDPEGVLRAVVMRAEEEGGQAGVRFAEGFRRIRFTSSEEGA